MPFLITVLTVLTLGDPSLSLHMIKNSDLKFVEQDQEMSQWKRSINRGLDRVDIDLKVALSSTVDIDKHIQSADGIIYFLDPNDQQSFELFELQIDIIQKMERILPIIVVFYTRNGFINIPSNYLLEHIWENYLMEAFVYDAFSKNTFYEVLECLTEAMTVGNVPINVETAWMRIPFFVTKINRLLDEELYKDAGNIAEILKNMKEKFDKQDYYITAEQAAWLYYKSGEYWKTSNVLKGIGNYSEKYMRIHVENLIHQANLFYKMNRFRRAAEKYEQARNIAKIEIKDEKLANSLLKLAIKAYIKSTDFLDAFKLLEKLDYNNRIELMRELTEEIGQSIDILIENNQFDLVKGYLYFVLNELQQNDLFEETKVLGTRMEKVLKILIDKYIQENNSDEANRTLDELFDFWDIYPNERENLDHLIREIALLYLSRNEIKYFDDLINKIESKSMRKELAEKRQETEDRVAQQRKQSEYEDFSQTITILKNYVDKENELFDQSNEEFYKHIRELIKLHKLREAISEFKKRAKWFKNIDHKRYYYELLIRLLDLNLELDDYFSFLNEIKNVRNTERLEYLNNTTSKINEKINLYLSKSEGSIEKIELLVTRFIELYNNNLLFEQTKNLKLIYIQILINRAKKLLDSSPHLEEVPKIYALVERAEIVHEGLTEEDPLDFDEIFQEIAQRHIYLIKKKVKARNLIENQIQDNELANFSLKEIQGNINTLSHIINQIKNPKIRTTLVKTISDIEDDFNIPISDDQKKLELTASLSNIRKRAHEEMNSLEDVQRKRTTFIRIYKPVLDLLNKGEFKNASVEYFKQAIKQSKRRDYDTASVLFLLGTLCLFKIQESTENIIAQLDKRIVGEPIAKEILKLLVESRSNGFLKIFDEAWEIAKMIPVFEEEKVLFTDK